MGLTPDERARLKDALNQHVRAKTRPDEASQEDRDKILPNVSLDLLVALAGLTPDQREAWVDRNILRLPGNTVGRTMNGISRERVRQLEKEAANHLMSQPFLKQAA